MFIATLVAAGALTDALVSEWAYQFDIDWTAGDPIKWAWIDEGFAADLTFSPATAFSQSDSAHLADGLLDLAERIASANGVSLAADVIVQPAADRLKRLLVADMDSTMITVECIDELADYAGIKAEVAAVTEAAMRGELDFATALDARVALLKGMDAATLDRCHAERVRIMPGAKALVRTLKARGGRAVLVSGGFTAFADRVGAEIGFDRVIANRLESAGGLLTGRVARPIVGADAKRATLLAEASAMGIGLAETLAIGDGANDIPMIEAAGLGVAYHAKPRTSAAADARIAHGDLSTMLYAMGIPRAEWVE